MKDFENNDIQQGDEVIVAFNKFKTTQLKRGCVEKTDIKQAGMLMALIKYTDGTESRVASKNISVVT